jgi:hypothetical protein
MPIDFHILSKQAVGVARAHTSKQCFLLQHHSTINRRMNKIDIKSTTE